MKSLFFIRLWIAFSAFLTATGWLLSTIHQLNRSGYLVVMSLAAVGMFLYFRYSPIFTFSIFFPFRRFRRWFPLGFLILAVLAFLGGILYPPTNFDGLAYRTPRVLHWFFSQQWHWIHTPDERMNTRACGFEWMTVPLLIFTGSDQLFFLGNWISYLLLPSALFSFLRAFHVPGRVAWSWAWIFPTGYCFILQAGSIANDAMAATYVLASLSFAQRFKTTHAFPDFAYSLLGIALTTGVKAINLALLLPWLVAIFPSFFLLFPHWKKLLIIAPLALLVSFFPNAVLNQIYCGDWTGTVLEPHHFILNSPLVGLAGNSLLLLWDNLLPPFLPWASSFVEWYPHSHLYQSLDWMNRSFETHYWSYLNILPAEGWAGLGLGITGLFLISIIAAKFQKNRPAPALPWSEKILLYSPYVALLTVMLKSALAEIARLVSAYYPIFLPIFLQDPAHSKIVRSGWWQRLCFCVWAVALGILILAPARHLWPAETLFSHLHSLNPSSQLWKKNLLVYSTSGDRSDWLASVRVDFPSEVHRFGLLDTANERETSLWLPFGSRSFYHITNADSPESLTREKINYVVLMKEALAYTNTPLDQWLATYHGRVLAQKTVEIPLANETTHWLLIKIERPSDSP